MIGLALAPLQVGAYALAAILVPFGIFMLWGGRDFTPPPLDDELHPPPPPRTPLHALRNTLSRASRTTVGLCALIAAYHAVAWTHPHLHLLQVPLQRWWILAMGIFLALWSSLAMDRHFK